MEFLIKIRPSFVAPGGLFDGLRASGYTSIIG